MSSEISSEKISSEKQQEASRLNGTLSIGPVTPEGKASSSRNAVKHGIYTKAVVLQNESPELYQELHHTYMSEWSPVGEREAHLVTDLVNARWRLTRIVNFETAAIDYEIDQQRKTLEENMEKVDQATRATLAFAAMSVNLRSGLGHFERYEARLYRNIERTTAQLERLQMRRQLPAKSNFQNSIEEEQAA